MLSSATQEIAALHTGSVGWRRVNAKRSGAIAAGVGKFVRSARRNGDRVPLVHFGLLSGNLRGKLAFKHNQHLVALAMCVWLFAARFARIERHARHLAASGGVQNLKTCAGLIDVRLSVHR